MKIYEEIHILDGGGIMKFDDQAASWDVVKRVQRAKYIADEIDKAVGIKKSLNAMEFGCGTGLVSFNMHDKFKNITLVDTSTGMIDKLNFKIKEQNIKNMQTFCMNINEGHEALEKFDVIYTSMAMHHILDIETTIRNLYNLINEEGCLCIVDLNEEDGSFHSDDKDFTGHNGFNQEELAGLLKKTGFRDVYSETIYNDIKEIDDIKIDYSLFLMKGIK
jgi:2-polyprenyl-3-methyl-5-hydroxy-6-metoxy-1,4-benzoquinol methylase